MSARSKIARGCVGFSIALSACGPSGEGADAGAAMTSGDAAVDAGELAQPRLGPGQIRVPLFVLPGDAEVEVEGQTVRRRSGVIHLVGKAGDKLRVRVSKGPLSMEKEVALEGGQAKPGLLDLDKDATPAATFGASHALGADAGAKGPSSKDLLLPETFE